VNASVVDKPFSPRKGVDDVKSSLADSTLLDEQPLVAVLCCDCESLRANTFPSSISKGDLNGASTRDDEELDPFTESRAGILFFWVFFMMENILDMEFKSEVFSGTEDD
jgi:hypothetical protein